MAWWVPPDQRGPEYPIFYPLYECRANAQSLRSIEDIRRYGTYSTGDPTIDRAVNSNKGSFWMRIHQIAEHVSNGVDISIVRQQDTKKIFDDITRYLEYRLEFLRQQLRVKNQQLVDDLIKLDVLRMKLYPYAKPFFPATPSGSDLVDLATSGGAGFTMPLEKPVETPVNEAVEEEGPESMADVFAQYRSTPGNFEPREKRWN